jgi:type II secretory pathway pseudopilin PulG
MSNTVRHEPSNLEETTPRRSAFTLLEVVFALALSVLLMAALLSAVDLFRRVSTIGRDEVARAQLARAILRQMEIDIRGCRFSVTPDDSISSTAAAGSGDTGEDETEEVTTTVTAEAAAEAYTGRNIGVMGDATTLMVHLSRSPRPIDAYRQSGAPAMNETTSDLRSVAYFLATPGAAGLSGVAGSLLESGGAVVADNGSVGLARLAGDPLSLEAVDAAADIGTLAANTRLLAAEVETLAFRYFDGTEWYDTWNSVEQERLPIAVEITLSIAAAVGQSRASSSASNGAGTVSEVYRLVVPLAAAEPADTTDSLFSF